MRNKKSHIFFNNLGYKKEIFINYEKDFGHKKVI